MTQEQIDAIILDFLKAYKAWADEDAPEGSVFCRKFGLCSNLENFAEITPEAESNSFKIRMRLEKLLPSAITPFDAVGRKYWDDKDKGTHHRNPARMAWVSKQIERMERCIA